MGKTNGITTAWRWAAIGVFSLAVALRLAGLAELRLFGDAASSLYFADRDFLEIARRTAIDSHPPLYYWVLRGALELFGWNELGARVPSVVPGVILVAFVLMAGRRLGGQAAGLGAGLLVAISPPLILYSRQPRMYALLALLATMLLVLSVRRGRSWPLFLVALVSLFTHYFAIVPVVIAGFLRIGSVGQGAPFVHSLRAGFPLFLAIALWLPWLGYALPESLRHTSRTISGVPPPSSLVEFLADLAVFVSVGTYLETGLSTTLAAAAWAGVVILVVLRLAPLSRYRPVDLRRIAGTVVNWWPLPAFTLGVVGASLIYVAGPAFGRPRFFIGLIPWLVLSITWLLGSGGGHGPDESRPAPPTRRSWLTVLAFLLFGGSAALALPPTLSLERGGIELDAVRLTERLDREARSEDGVILHAWWQHGYLRAHLTDPPALVDLRDLELDSIPGLVQRHRSLWLAMYGGVGRDDPRFPIEAELDRTAYRVDERVFGPTRLVRYSAPGPAREAPSLEFGNSIQVTATLRAREVRPGDAVPVDLTWKATAQVADQVVSFLHLLDSEGRGWAGRDAEPDERRPSQGWTVGESFAGRRGLVVPVWTPPGEYRVVTGLYRRSDGRRLTAADRDFLVVSQLTIRPPDRSQDEVARFDGHLQLNGFSIERPDEVAAERVEIDTVDGRQSLVTPIDAAPGSVLGLVTHWTSRERLPPLTMFVHLIDDRGMIVAQRDGPPVDGRSPTDRWANDVPVVDRREIPIPEALPAGSYRLFLGWYRGDGSRLFATAPNRTSLGDRFEIGRIRLGRR